MFRLTQFPQKPKTGTRRESRSLRAPPALGTSKYSVDLRAEEKLWGGHAIRDHVGKTEAELIAQVESTRVDSPAGDGLVMSKYTPQGTYLSPEAANDFINRLLQSHTDDVERVAGGQWDQAWIEDRIGSKTGIEAFLDAQEQVTIRDTFNAGVLIVHDDRVPCGYRVKTAYPRNDRNSYPLLTPTR
jgi:Bacterial CdiA-CT RNAse A domain